MIRKTVDNVSVELTNCADMPMSEIAEYVKYVRHDLQPGVILTKVIITLQPDDMVALDWEIQRMKFDRIRRITGKPTR